MLRPVPRLLRTPAPRSLLIKNTPPRRNIGFARPSQQRRSWKNYAARWGVAIGGIYLYNTSEWFQGESAAYKRLLEHQVEDEILPTIDTIATQRRDRKNLALAAAGTSPRAAAAADIEAPLPTSLQSTAASSPTSPAQGAIRPATIETTSPVDGAAAAGSPEELEEEAAGEGAFNEETGEINWDCPCLGGMAHGPCGPEFREAFSCFVYSKEEPKGVDCIERFKTMQDCFRKHPDIYGSELSDDPEDDEEYQAARGDAAAGEATPLDLTPDDKQPPISSSSEIPSPAPETSHTPSTPTQPITSGEKVAHGGGSPTEEKAKTQRAKAAKKQVESDHGVARDTGSGDRIDTKPKASEDDAGVTSRSETDDVVPRAWFDNRDAEVPAGEK